MTGREAAAEALAGMLREATPASRALARKTADALLAAIERGDIPGVTLAPVCSTCDGTGLVDWEPGAHRDSEDDQQPCPDCRPRPGVGVLPESETLTEEEGADLAEAATVWALSAPGAQSLDRWDAVVAAVERILAGRRARPASVDAETHWSLTATLRGRHITDDMEDEVFIGPEMAEHIGRKIVRLLASGVTLAADREPDGLRAKVEALLSDSCHHCGRLPDADGDHSCPCPLSDSECLEHTADPVVSRTRLRALLAHPATDQEEADRG